MTRDKYAEYLFHQGTNYAAYKYLGHFLTKRKCEYEYVFRTWAPNAYDVRLISDFTDWDYGMSFERITEGGIWQCVFKSKTSLEGMAYKFLIISEKGSSKKGDPYARYSKGGADGASIIWCEDDFKFTDRAWMNHRKKTINSKNGYYIPTPINIYEMHLGSFMRHEDGSYYSYSELSEILPSYVKKMGYTHVEFLPLTEYPYDGSWGYQVGAFFAPTSRFGTPSELKGLVNALHKAGVGVIMDFVPAHFPKDAWGLYEFDTYPLYEYQGKDRQESRSWGTRFFDVGRCEVQSFLISSAMYFLREFHFDGLRVDAVASMLYLDYDREPGEWFPNEDGTNENKEASAFFRKLNTTVFDSFSDVLMIAEESTAFAGVTKPVSDGGLGFNLKWNMGFANDIFDYISTDPLFRKYKHNALTFPIMYAHSENYCLTVSHDEVVHGKCSLIGKIFGSYEDKFKTLRTLMILIMTYPGKKMLFMGSEYAQFREWNFDDSLEWFMLDYPNHSLYREYVQALNNFYLKTPELYEIDFSYNGFSWLSCDENDKSSIAYRRYSLSGDYITIMLNFSGAPQTLTVDLKNGEKLSTLFSSTTEENLNIKYVNLTGEDGKLKVLARVELPPFYGAILREGGNKKIIKV